MRSDVDDEIAFWRDEAPAVDCADDNEADAIDFAGPPRVMPAYDQALRDFQLGRTDPEAWGAQLRNDRSLADWVVAHLSRERPMPGPEWKPPVWQRKAAA